MCGGSEPPDVIAHRSRRWSQSRVSEVQAKGCCQNGTEVRRIMMKFSASRTVALLDAANTPTQSRRYQALCSGHDMIRLSIFVLEQMSITFGRIISEFEDANLAIQIAGT